MYVAAGEGKLTFVKDGTRTLCVVDSMIDYAGSQLQPVTIKPPPPREAKRKSSKNKTFEATA